MVEKVSDLLFEASEDDKGVLYREKMYLIAEQIALSEDANKVIFHEFFGHFGLRGFFGSTLDTALLNIHENNPLLRQYTNNWMRSNRDLQSWYKMSNLDYHYRATEEAMEPMSQEDRPFTFAKRFLSTVQSMLRNIGKPFNGSLITQFPESDQGRLSSMVIDWERNGEGRSQGNPNPTSPASTSPDSRQGTFRVETTSV